ncbi:hypothetical protein [Nocardiopsis sp. NPDC006938]|uniref:hypothetical protein n=1 Tax=Nocardiopsis sp. NPDC006938 TaxID=3364337 RepID=UPI0036A2E3F3
MNPLLRLPLVPLPGPRMSPKHDKPIVGLCERCGEYLNAGVRTCPNCGHYNG